MQVPSWEALAAGLRPKDVDMESEPTQTKHGWQKIASVTIQNAHRETVVWPTHSPAEQAMARSQSGPLASVPFAAMPTSHVTRIASDLFRVLLLRRLRCPLPLCVRSCRCGRLLDVLGHHRAACSTRGALGARSTSANYDFGQLFFSSSANSTSANFDFGQFRFRPISTSANFDFGQFDFGQFLDVEFWDDKGWSPEGWGSKGWGSKGWGPKGWGNKRLGQ